MFFITSYLSPKNQCALLNINRKAQNTNTLHEDYKRIIIESGWKHLHLSDVLIFAVLFYNFVLEATLQKHSH